MSNNALSLLAAGNGFWGGTPLPIRESDQQLMDACNEGDLQKARDAFNQGADPNMWVQAPLYIGTNKLMFICVEKGHIDIVKELVQMDSNLIHKKYDFSGVQPLQAAAEYDQYEICQWLIKQGADVNGHDKMHRTALIEAAVNGCLNLVKLLVENDADVNTWDIEGFTAVAYCLDFVDDSKESEHWECIKYLLQNGATPNGYGKHTGNTVLKYAVIKNDIELVEKLYGEYGFYLTLATCVDNDGKTPMDYAEEIGDEEMLECMSRFADNKQVAIELPCIIL